jgi:hypothetical protein
MKKIYTFLLALLTIATGQAQINYDFSATAGTFTELVGGTSPTFTAVTTYDATDEGYANNLPIGFTFAYNGSNYTTFHINSNGFIGLGSAFTNNNVYWRNDTGLENGPFNGTANDITASRPIIAPLWDDLNMASTNNISYSTSGVAGNRILTVQWKEVLWDYTATTPCISFQIKLYEQNGKIEFIYRSEAGSLSAPSASSGITASGIGANNFISINALTLAATSSKTVHTSTINAKPSVNGLTFSFTPSTLSPQDAQVEGWVNLPATTCFSTPQSITVRLRNAGSSIINANAVSINLTSTGANTSNNLTITNPTSIAVGATQDVTFTNVNLNLTGATVLTAVATLASDPTRSNDTGRVTINTAPSVSTFPVNESAEVNPLTFGWLRAIAGSNAWALETNGYRNAGLTANTADSLYPQSGSTFFLFNSYNAPAGTRTILYSNCFNLPTASTGMQFDISFWMSHDTSYANDRDSLYLVISTDRGQTWNRIQGFQRYDPLFTIPNWKVENISLLAYAGQTIQIGFEGVSKFGNIIGLDNIVVRANAALPVTFASFTGKTDGTANVLNWTTANEQNNQGFEVLRSTDGRSFSKIGFVASTYETTTRTTNYSFTDKNAVNATNYYRLKQLDKDGKSSYSSVVVLRRGGRKLEIANIYPNPTVDVLNAVISSDKEEKVTLAIVDIAGRVITSQQVTTTLGSVNVSFNIKSLSKGTYFIKLINTSTSETQTERFIKQ